MGCTVGSRGDSISVRGCRGGNKGCRTWGSRGIANEVTNY